MDKIKCPYCGKLVELSGAIIHEISEEIRREEKDKLRIQFEKEKIEELAKREKQIKESAEKENEALKKKLEILIKDAEIAEKKIREDALKKAEEEQRLKIKEKDLQLEEIRKVNEELKRKLEQGSQQRQGEVLELDLEEQLKKKFPQDRFIPIPKGAEGADIFQKVMYRGAEVGSIIWETKRTKAWSRGWLAKLKDDAGKVSATEAVIVTKTLPDNITNFDRLEGVWVTGFENALSIARYIRFLITTVSQIKTSTDKPDEEWQKIKDYMLSDAFKHRMQAHFDGIKSLREDLQQEVRNTTIRWKKREKQIEKLDSNTTNFYGELRAIVSDLPKIEGIDQDFLLEDENKDQTLF